MKRTKTYLGTFVNSPEGISSYRLMVKAVRNTVTGGRFVKMFRGNPKPRPTNRRDGSTYFDVYLLSRFSWNRAEVFSGRTWVGYKLVPVRNEPKFFNFVLSR